jgi:hypothetical protein
VTRVTVVSSHVWIHLFSPTLQVPQPAADLWLTRRNKKSDLSDMRIGPKLLGSFPRKNPMSGKIEKKLAYWERKDDLIFKAGTYEAG